MNRKPVFILTFICLLLIVVLIMGRSYYLHEIEALKENVKPCPTEMSESYKEQVSSFIDKNIEDIAGKKHIAGGKWVVSKLTFMSSEYVLINYEDGHEPGQVVIKIGRSGNSITYKIIS